MLDLERFEIKLQVLVESPITDIYKSSIGTYFNLEDNMDEADIVKVIIIERSTGFTTDFKTNIPADATESLIEVIQDEIDDYFE